MTNNKLQITNNSKISNIQFLNRPQLLIGALVLFVFWGLFLLISAEAMGSKPKEEQRYKLEVLKMEIVPAYQVTPEAKTPAKKKGK